VPDDDFPAFYAASYARIVGLVIVLLGERAEAEDIAQEASARALRRWPQIRTYDAPEAWVRRSTPAGGSPARSAAACCGPTGPGCG
jgi:RNA polymerase sigma-70 factor (ECF subfamily)